MNTATIQGSATALPPRRFSQEETFHLLGYTSPRVRQIFLNSDIDSRHFWADPSSFSPDETPDQLHARYEEGALHLACLAARSALANAGIAAQGADAILVASCTGYLCPELATRLVGHLGMRLNVERGALMGHGCAGAMPLLQRAWDHAVARPGKCVVAIAVEICSATYFVDHSLETAVGNAICADGAAAVVLATEGASNGKPMPKILGFQSEIDPAHLDKVGFEQKEGKLRIILASEIRDLAGPIMERCLENLLKPRGLGLSDVRHWILHPGGRKVIESAAGYLGLREEQLRHSREILRRCGNMSSPTVLFVLNEVLTSDEVRPGDYGVMMALGPGFVCEAALLQW